MPTNAPALQRTRRAGHLRLERRWKDRRIHRANLIFPERRSGFERRSPYNRSALLKVIDMALVALRDSGPALVVTLVLVNVLNLLDYVFTVNALAAGMSEGNPIMDFLFEYDVRLAGVVKMLAMLGVTWVIWRNRRYRIILACALITLAAYLVLLTYHIYGAAMFY